MHIYIYRERERYSYMAIMTFSVQPICSIALPNLFDF